MKKCFFNNFKNLNLNKNQEYTKLSFKVINNSNFGQKYILDFKLKNNNFCVETGSKRSVDSFFLLNRMNIKKNLNLCKLSGVKKLSW